MAAPTAAAASRCSKSRQEQAAAASTTRRRRRRRIRRERKQKKRKHKTQRSTDKQAKQRISKRRCRTWNQNVCVSPICLASSVHGQHPHADARKDAEDRMKASKETYYAAGSEMAIGTPECTRYP